jgi:hypothetical protein
MNSADATTRPVPASTVPASTVPASTVPASTVPARARLAALLGIAGLAALTGCGSSGASAAGPTASAGTGTSNAATATSTGVPVTSAPATPTPAAAASSAAPSALPALGRMAGVFAHGSVGFGQVRPAEVFNGGDPTGLINKITWQSWGGAIATGTGTSTYVGPNQSVAAGQPAPATIVAFDLGTCNGTYMYQAVEWFFPQHGQSFNARVYENVCTGSYVGQ